MYSKLTYKATLTDGSTVTKSFDKIPGEVGIEAAKNFLKTIMPLIKAVAMTFTLSQYQTGGVESE